jgi:phospholipase/carboxylesterase
VSVPDDAVALVVLLHGYGDPPGRLRETLAPSLPIGSGLVVPTGPVHTADGPAWFAGEPDGDGPPLSETLDALASLIEQSARTTSLDDRAITVVGYSQGAATALALACRATDGWRPHTTIAIAPWLTDEPDISWDFAAAADRGGRVLLVQGEHDDVVPTAQARSAARVLERHEVSVTLIEHPGGHALDDVPADAVRRWWQAPH